MADTAHSKYSASASDRWLSCPGSIVLSSGKPNKSSVHAARGTVAHTLLEWAILQKLERCHDEWLGAAHDVDGHEVIVDDGIIDNVNWALRHIGEITLGCDIVQAETRVNYAHWLGVPEDEGWGTSDVIAVNAAQRELIVADYKNGHKPVDAVDNTQMMLYAGGALTQFEDVVDIDTVRMVILQPEAGSPKEWAIPVAELRAWLTGRARSGAVSVQQAERLYPDASEGALPAEWVDTFLRPSPSACQWCRAKATCPKLRGEVFDTVIATRPADPEEFEVVNVPGKPHIKPTDASWLSACMGKIDLIEAWCTAVREEVAHRLNAGQAVPGYKLVQGKKGARAWSSSTEAEEQLKAMRLKVEEMYDLKLISPTSAEKLTAGEKPVIGPRQWKKLQALVKQADGKPHVAPESDPRSAINVQPVEEMFEAQVGDLV